MVHIAALAQSQWPEKKHGPYFQYDNASWQENAKYSRMGIKYHQRIKITPHSADFAKPIEHVFHQIKELLCERFYNSTETVTAQLVQQWIREIWEDDITTASIAKDVKSLRKTYLAVKTDKGVEERYDDGSKVVGTGGDYPAAPLR